MSTLTSMSKEQIKELRARAEAYTIGNNREGYDSFWADEQLVDLYLEPGRIANFRFVAEMCADWPGAAIDLGCGCGTMLVELLAADRTGAKTVSGVDFSQSAVERCRQLLPQGKFHQRDLCDTGLADASFDLLLSIQTMEHMDHPRKAFDEMWRLMRRGARLVVTIPNGKLDDWEGHRNFWTSESFIQMAGRSPVHLRSINDNRNLLFLFQKSAD